jgi:hypothetical protein
MRPLVHIASHENCDRTLADGFVVMPAYFPGAIDDFVDGVVPELQRRGLYRLDYGGPTLRHHLGLAMPSWKAQGASRT